MVNIKMVEKLANGLFFGGKINFNHFNKCNTKNIYISWITNSGDGSYDDKPED